MIALQPVTLAKVEQARQRLAAGSRGGFSPVRTPLLALEAVGWSQPGATAEIFLKPENLQPVGSFKLRGAANALLALWEQGPVSRVWTASAGNMGLGLAWVCQRLGVACTAVAPDDAPPVKLQAIRRLGAEIVRVPFAEYQRIQQTHAQGERSGNLIHPFADPDVMAGNGTIGLEILEDLPEVDTIFVPYGGGGLSCGLAAAVHALSPAIKVIACEVETAAPLAAAWAAGERQQVVYTPSFISGMGAPFVFDQMWPLARDLLDGVVVVSLEQARAALRRLAGQAHLVAEGAGAVATAAALAVLADNPVAAPGGLFTFKKAVCLVSGGNIDREVFLSIMGEYDGYKQPER